jgi:hypothetical protein
VVALFAVFWVGAQALSAPAESSPSARSAAPRPEFVVVQPDRLGPARVGERESALLAAIGPGVVTRRGPLDATIGYRYRERTYARRGLVVEIAVPRHGRALVGGAHTDDERYRTRSGVGVGSYESQVRHLPGVHCYEEVRCQIGHSQAMLFVLASGRVITIVVVASGAG